MRIVGVLILVVGLMVGIGSNLPSMIDPPSVIIVIAFVLGVLLMSGTRIESMVASIFSTDSRPEELASAARGWALARRASVAGGAVGTLTGGIIMLKHLDDLAALGPGAAIGLLTMLYGLVIGYGFCLPCQKHLETRAGQ